MYHLEIDDRSGWSVIVKGKLQELMDVVSDYDRLTSACAGHDGEMFRVTKDDTEEVMPGGWDDMRRNIRALMVIEGMNRV